MKNAGLFGGALLVATQLAACAPHADRDPSAMRDMPTPMAGIATSTPGGEGRPNSKLLVPMPRGNGAAPPAVSASEPLASALAPAEPGALRAYTEEEDFDGDGIADTRTIRRFKYDASGRACRLVIERDFDADGTIDARSVNTSAYGDTETCGT